MQFGEWTPDQSEIQSPNVSMANNVIATPRGYRPFPSLSAYGGVVSANDVLAAFSPRGADFQPVLVAATDSEFLLFGDVDSGWTDISTLTAVPDAGSVSFTNYGARIIAASPERDLLTYNAGVATNFETLVSGIKARHVATISEFVVIADVEDEDGHNPQRVRWSGLGKPAEWDYSSGDMSDINDLRSGGPIMGLESGGDYGLVLCYDSLWRMSFVGAPVIFQFVEVVRGRGCVASGSVASVGRTVFFLAQDGFYSFDGQSLQPIGTEKINRYFQNVMNPSQLDQMSVAVDPDNTLIGWSFCSTDSTSPDRILLYNWAVQRWSIADANVRAVASLVSKTYTMEDLDNLGTADEITTPFDSYLWEGGNPIFGAITTDNQLKTFTGIPLPATITTGAIMPAQTRTLVTGARPQVDGGVSTCSVASVSRTEDNYTFSQATEPNTDTGMCPLRSEGRYHRIRTSITGVWKHATGVDVEFKPTGRR